MAKKEEYKAPDGKRILNERPTRELYRLEAERDEAIMRAGRELMNILGHTKDQFYTHILPEVLLNILDSFDRHASVLAAKAYLTYNDYKDENS